MAKITLVGFTAGLNRKMIHFSVRPNFHRCTVCNCIPEASMQLPCGHFLCSVCVTVSVTINRKTSCPRDRVEFNIADAPIKMIDVEAIVGLSVVCSNSSRGCSYVGPLGSLIAHEDKCRYHLQTCRYCGQDIIYHQLVDHIRSECTGVKRDVGRQGEQAAASVCENLMDKTVVAQFQNKSNYGKEVQCKYRNVAASVDEHVDGIRKQLEAFDVGKEKAKSASRKLDL